MTDLPSFDPDHEPPKEVPPPPRKPRPKPTRKNKARKVRSMADRVSSPPKKARRKKHAAKRYIVPAQGPINASLFTACLQISNILTPFSKSDRRAVLKAIGDMVEAAS